MCKKRRYIRVKASSFNPLKQAILKAFCLLVVGLSFVFVSNGQTNTVPTVPDFIFPVCDTNEILPFPFISVNSNDPMDTTLFVVIDEGGSIINISSDTFFTPSHFGVYLVYGVTYTKSNPLLNLSIGNNIENVDQAEPQCMAWSDSLAIGFCNSTCDFYESEIIRLFVPNGFSYDQGMDSLVFILTDLSGDIIEANGNSEFTSSPAAGQYFIYTLLYEKSAIVNSLMAGNNLADVTIVGCYDWSGPIPVQVCPMECDYYESDTLFIDMSMVDYDPISDSLFSILVDSIGRIAFFNNDSIFAPIDTAGIFSVYNIVGEKTSLNVSGLMISELLEDISISGNHEWSGPYPIKICPDTTVFVDLALIKKLSPDQTNIVDAGDTVSFTIQIFNQSGNDANNILIEDRIPTDFTLISGGDFVMIGSDSVIAEMQFLMAGAVDSVNIQLIVDSSYQGTQLTNIAEIIGQDEEDSDSTPDSGGPEGPDNDTMAIDGTDDLDFETIEVNQSYDLALRKRLAVNQFDTIRPGDTVYFDITLFNQGTLDADSISIVDWVDTSKWLPFDTVLNGGWTSIHPDTGLLNLNSVPPISPGDSMTASVILVSRTDATGRIGNTSEIYLDDGMDDDSTPNNEDLIEDDIDTVSVDLLEYNLSLSKNLSVSQSALVMPGDTVGFDIDVTNIGTDTAFSVSIIDYIDTSSWLPFDTFLNPDWDFVSSDSALFDFALGLPLLPGNTMSISIQLVVRNDFEGTLQNVAEIYSDDGFDINSNPESEQQDGVSDLSGEDDIDAALLNAAPFDLSLEKTLVSNGLPIPGDTVTFRIFVRNEGVFAASNVIVKDYIPSGLSLVDPDWNIDSTINIGMLSGFQSDSIDIDLRIDSTFTGDSLMNKAEIYEAVGGKDIDSTPGDEVDGQDDIDTAIVRINQYFDLALNKNVDGVGPFLIGDTVTFNIIVTNQGTLPATNVVIRDFLPDSLLLADSDWNSVDTSFLIDSIASGESVSVNIDLKIADGFTGNEMTNNVEIVSAEGGDDVDSTPDNGSNNEDDDDFATIVVDFYDLALRKSVLNGAIGPFDLFDDIDYQVTLFNQGTLPVFDIEIIDYLPQGLQLSASDMLWTMINNDEAKYNFPDTLSPGDSVTIPLIMNISPFAYLDTVEMIFNYAEIVSAKGEDGEDIKDNDSVGDEDSTNDNGDIQTDDEINDDGSIDEDDSDLAIVLLEELDPLGYIYCEKSGQIITGGLIEVTGPGNVLFTVDSTGTPQDGRSGYYQFLVDQPGDYQISYSHPDGYPLSTMCLPLSAPFNPAGLEGTALDKDGTSNNNLVMGSGASNGFLINDSCSFNNYFLGVTLNPSSPPVISNNNIPVQCIEIGSQVCDDFNSDGAHDFPLEGFYQGEKVYLHYCADTINPIDSAVTDFFGQFNFSLLLDSCYRLRFEIPTGRFISNQDNVDPVTGWSFPVNLEFGECDSTTTICLAPCNVSCITNGINPTSCSAGDGSITITPSGGLGTYEYSLDNINFQSSNVFDSLDPGSFTVYTRDVSGCVGQCSVDLVSPSGLTCTLEVIDPTCSTDLGVIIVNALGGSGVFEYRIDSGTYQTSDTFFNVSDGFHMITVRDANEIDCTSSCSGTVAVPSEISCSLVAVDPTCSTGFGSIMVMGSGGSNSYEYSLDSGPFVNNSLFLNVDEGSHTVIIRDILDSTCFSVCSTLLVAPPPISCVATPTDPTCSTGTGSISVIGSGGNGVYQFSLNGGPFQNSGLFTNVSGGVHTITVRDSSDISCTSTCVTTLSAPPALNCSTVAADPTCSTGTGSITVSGSGGSGMYQFSLDSGAFQFSNIFNGLTPGTYMITIRDMNDFNCVSTCSATIGNAVPLSCSVSVTDPLCSTDFGLLDVTGFGGSGIYEYSLDGGPFQPGNIFSNATDGFHTITIRDANDPSCTSTCTATVTMPSPLSCNPFATNPTCYDGLGVIQVTGIGGSGSYRFRLDGGPAQSSGIFIDVNDGFHTITVIDQIDTSCTSTCGVIIDIPDSISCSTSVVNPTCSGGVGTINVLGLGGSGSYMFSLNGGSLQSSGSFPDLIEGVYTIEVFDLLDNSCMSSCTATISAPPPLNCSTVVSYPSCDGSLGIISVEATGGSGIYQYSLNGGAYQSGKIFNDVPFGSHIITVRDIIDISCTTTCGATVVDLLPLSCTAIPTNPTCLNQLGMITVIPSGGSGVYEYSLDGLNFVSDNVFTDLVDSTYLITIRDSLSSICISTCEASIFIPALVTCSVTDPECFGDLGIISVTAVGAGNNFEYSLDSGAYTSSNVFTDVTPGMHIVHVRDTSDLNCVSSCEAIIVEPEAISCVISKSNPTCNLMTGSFTVNAIGGSGLFEYSIDGVNFGPDSIFNGLPAGIYTFTVRDVNSTNCISTCTDSIASPLPLSCSTIVTNPLCGDETGTITVIAMGGSGNYEYSLNGGPFILDPEFTGLFTGNYNVIIRDQVDTLCSTSCSADVLIPASINCSASSNNPDCGEEFGSIDVAINNSVGAYTISWQLSTGGTVFSDNSALGMYTIPNLSNGLWEVSIADSLGCITTCNAEVVIPLSFSCLTTSINPECHGDLGSILVDISGPMDNYMVSWRILGTSSIQSQNNITDTFMIDNLAPGDWEIIITNDNNCESSCITTLIEPPILTCEIQSISHISCFGADDGMVVINGIGGSGDLIFSIDGIGSNNTGIFNDLAPGSYNASVGDISGCVSNCSFEISGPTQLMCNAVVSIPVTCGTGDNGEITVIASGGELPYTYTLGLESNNSGVFEDLEVGVYTVEVEDGNGCTSICEVTITTPSDDLSCSISLESDLSCSGAKDAIIKVVGTGGTGPYYYQLGSETNTSGEFANLSAGTWSVFIFDANGCANYCTITINNPQTLTCTIDVNQEITCRDGEDGILTVNVVGGQTPFQYRRNGGAYQNSSTFSNVEAGISTIEVLDANGCFSTCDVLFKNPVEFFCLLGEVKQISCSGESDGGFQAKGCEGVEPYEYSLNGGIFSEVNVWSDLAPGEYIVTVRDANGCESTCDLLLLEPEEIVCNIIQHVNPECEADNGLIEVTASGGIGALSYQLNDNPLQPLGLFENLSAGTYQISIHDEYNCIKQCTTVILSIPDGPQATTEVVEGPICGADSSARIITTVSGGVAPYEFSLDGGLFVNSGEFLDLNIGNHTVEVRDANGCTFVSIVEIIDPKNLTCTVISTTDAVCDNPLGGAANIFAEGGLGVLTYTLSNGVSNNTGLFTGLVSGTYSVIIEDSNGCSTSCEFEIILDVDNTPEAELICADSYEYLGCNPSNIPTAHDYITNGSVSAINGSVVIFSSDIVVNGCTHLAEYVFRAVNQCGNPSGTSCSITLEWEVDTIAPVISTVLEDIIVYRNKDVPTNTVIEVTDECGTFLESFTEENLLEECGFSLHRKWIFSDSCGNKDSTEQIIYVRECSDTSFIDLELVKEVSKTKVEVDETVTFILTVYNKGNELATNVGIIDYLPGGYYDVSNISDGGVEIGATIVWSGFDLLPDESISVTFDAKVSQPLIGISYKNIAEVLDADQQDIDSDYGNDNGDQSEDDEDYAEVNIVTSDDYVDISLVKVVSDQSPDIRDVVTYTITIQNDGTITATDIEVTDYLPVDYCSEFINISDGGILIEDEIIWSDIDLQSGETMELTFDAVVSSSAYGQNVNNTAEVTRHNEQDVDSTPDNGDESEDDQDSAVFTVGNVSDLELNKRIVNTDAQVGDTVTFEIELYNNGPDPVTFAEVEDVIPDGFSDYDNISHNGQVFTNRMLWTVQNLGVSESVVFSFEARVVHFLNEDCDYRNIAQVTRSTSADPDSDPNNDDGDQSEDDEDWTELFIDQVGDSCIKIETAVTLEGAYDFKEGKMHSKLNQLGYLPGQMPLTFFGTRTEAGQPYYIKPWIYLGKEGERLDSNLPGIGDFGGYPEEAVDYVLVSLRSDVSSDSTKCEKVAILLRHGELMFFEDENCCQVDQSKEYFILIQHRNHLPVMSHKKIPFIGGKISYDFRIQDSYVNALGFGQKEVDNGRFAMFAGNGDQIIGSSSPVDINIRDLNVWLQNDGNNSSYYLRDYDLNGDVNVQDKALFLKNNGKFSDVRIE